MRNKASVKASNLVNKVLRTERALVKMTTKGCGFMLQSRLLKDAETAQDLLYGYITKLEADAKRWQKVPAEIKMTI